MCPGLFQDQYQATIMIYQWVVVENSGTDVVDLCIFNFSAIITVYIFSDAFTSFLIIVAINTLLVANDMKSSFSIMYLP